MEKRLLSVGLLFGVLYLVLGVSLVSAFPVYVTPLEDGSLVPSTDFDYVFNFTTSADCSGVLVSESESITTDSRGLGFVDLDTSGLASRPSYLCEYRDGALRKVHNFSDGMFGDVWAGSFIGDGSGLSNLNILGNESGFDGWDKNASDDMTYTNGSGLSLVGNVFSVVGSFFSGGWGDLTGVPAGFLDGVDNDSQLSEAEVDAFVGDNGYWNDSYAGFNESYADTLYSPLGIISNSSSWNRSGVNVYLANEEYNVGIGTTTPSTKLEVDGSINISGSEGALVFPDGTSMTSATVDDAGAIDGYDSSFFMPLNNSVSGDFDFNGGWESGGISFVDGDVYAQKGWFYDISSLEINHLRVNGSLFPDIDDQFDIGNGSSRWRDLRLSGEVMSEGVGDSYFMGNVGVGTETPGAKLEVVGNTNIQAGALTVTRDSAGYVTGFNQEGTGDIARFQNDGITKVVIDNGGNVGVGTVNPGSKLEVVGTFSVSSDGGGLVVDSDGNIMIGL